MSIINDDILGKIIQALGRQNDAHMQVTNVLVHVAMILPSASRTEVLDSIQVLLNANADANQAMGALLEAIRKVGNGS